MKSSCLRSFALCLCAMMFLSSCRSPAAASARQAEEPIENQGETSPSANWPGADLQMKIISSHNGIIASGLAGNEQGFYEVFYRPAGDGNILYTDYATQNRIYLSSQVAGEHKDESDTSWLKSTVGGCYLALTDENLILFKLNTPAFADEETEERRGYIARYDLNGAERQVLTWLSPNETIADGCIASDGEAIYYLDYLIQEDGKAGPFTLIQLNIGNGERKERCQLPQDAYHFIVGAYQDKLVIKSILNPMTITPELTAEDIIEAFKQQIHEVVLLSPDGQQQTVCQWKQGTRSEMFFDNKMIYWNEEHPGLYEQDWGSDSPVCLYSGPIADANGNTYSNVTLYADAFDGHILATAERDSDDQGKSARFAFDLEKKMFQELTLELDEHAVSILAEGAAYFLIQGGLREYPVQDYAPDGQQITTNMLLPEVYLMDKEAYWNNIPDYIAINDNVYI